MTNALLDSMREYEKIYGLPWVLHALELRAEYTLKASAWHTGPRENRFLGVDFRKVQAVRQFYQIYMILRDQGKWEEA